MALQTKTISAVSSNGNHKFTLKLVEESTNADTNKSNATLTFTLSPATDTAYGWNYTNKEPVTYTVVVGGTTYTGAIMSYTKNSTLTIFTKSLTPYHLVDGTRELPFSFEIKSLSGSLLPGTAAKSGVMSLTKINRASSFTTSGTWYIGTAPKKYITVSAYDSSFYHRVTYSMGSASGYLVGGKKEYVQGDDTYLIAIPPSVAEQIPNSTSGTLNVALETFYKDAETGEYILIGTSGKAVKVYVRSEEFAPVLDPIIVDTNPNTIALTGDENILIKHCSSVPISHRNVNAIGLGGATIKKITLNGKEAAINEAGEFVFPLVQPTQINEFAFVVTDSRGFTTSKTVTKTMIEYLRPTATIELTQPNGEGVMTIRVSGRFWQGNFGVADNTIAIQFRCKSSDKTDEDGGIIEEWLDWVSIPIENIQLSEWEEKKITSIETGEVTYYYVNEFTYEANAEYTVPDYLDKWTFEARIVDQVRTAVSAQSSVKAFPVFDWSEFDFNFNVPVTLQGDVTVNGNLTCNGEMNNAAGSIGRRVFSSLANVVSNNGILSSGGSHTAYAYVLNPFNMVFLRLYISGLSSAVSASTNYNTLCTLDGKFAPPGNIALTISSAKQAGVLINTSGDIRVIAPDGLTTGTQMYISGLYPLSSSSELYQSGAATTSLGGEE